MEQNQTDEGATCCVRMRRSFRDKIDETAAAQGLNRSEWVIQVLERAIENVPGQRRIVVQKRMFAVGSVAARLCNHPMALRSDRDERGNSRCLACDSIIRPMA